MAVPTVWWKVSSFASRVVCASSCDLFLVLHRALRSQKSAHTDTSLQSKQRSLNPAMTASRRLSVLQLHLRSTPAEPDVDSDAVRSGQLGRHACRAAAAAGPARPASGPPVLVGGMVMDLQVCGWCQDGVPARCSASQPSCFVHATFKCRMPSGQGRAHAPTPHTRVRCSACVQAHPSGPMDVQRGGSVPGRVTQSAGELRCTERRRRCRCRTRPAGLPPASCCEQLPSSIHTHLSPSQIVCFTSADPRHTGPHTLNRPAPQTLPPVLQEASHATSLKGWRGCCSRTAAPLLRCRCWCRRWAMTWRGRRCCSTGAPWGELAAGDGCWVYRGGGPLTWPAAHRGASTAARAPAVCAWCCPPACRACSPTLYSPPCAG